MKFNRRSFFLVFACLLNGLINNVISEETQVEAEVGTEDIDTTLATVVDNNEINSEEITGDEIESDEIKIDEISSDENFEDTNFDLSNTGIQISAHQIAPIINELLAPLSTYLGPFLGPYLGPLSSVLSAVISQTVTEVVVNLLNQTLASTKRQELLQIRNFTSYTSFLVTIPNNGRFLLLTKTPAMHTKTKRCRKNLKECI